MTETMLINIMVKRQKMGRKRNIDGYWLYQSGVNISERGSGEMGFIVKHESMKYVCDIISVVEIQIDERNKYIILNIFTTT